VSIEVRVGRDLEEFLVERLRRAERRLWVVSPWVSKEFIPILLEARSRGVDVRLITTDDLTPVHCEALKQLITRERGLVRRGSRAAKITGLTLIILGLIAALFTGGLGLVVSIIGFIILLVKGADVYRVYYVSQLGENLQVYHVEPGKTIHAKIYIVDDMLGVGSLNLTTAGVKRNLEALCWVKNPELVENTLKTLESIEDFSRVGLDEIGARVWTTPTKRKSGRAGQPPYRLQNTSHQKPYWNQDQAVSSIRLH